MLRGVGATDSAGLRFGSWSCLWFPFSNVEEEAQKIGFF